MLYAFPSMAPCLLLSHTHHAATLLHAIALLALAQAMAYAISNIFTSIMLVNFIIMAQVTFEPLLAIQAPINACHCTPN